MRVGARSFLLVAITALAACGPQLGSLQRGETGRVARVINGDTLQLDSGLRVFLAEVDAPRRDEPYASQAYGELEALALHRNVLLAYGGTRRWVRRTRETQAASDATQLGPHANQAGPHPPQSARHVSQPGQTDTAAIAQVFVQSEGGRWFWLQNALVARGAVMVRPRFDNHARTAQLLNTEAQARAASRGLWAQPAYQPLAVHVAADLALRDAEPCTRGDAPYRLIQGSVRAAQVLDNRGALTMDGASEGKPFSIVLFGDAFTHWDGPALASFSGARVRARGTLGAFHDQAQICLDDSRQLEVLHGAGPPAPAHPQSPT
jgi:endonuclease YncB( thermonuclease family)